MFFFCLTHLGMVLVVVCAGLFIGWVQEVLQKLAAPKIASTLIGMKIICLDIYI